jgi:hypothetical protein
MMAMSSMSINSSESARSSLLAFLRDLSLFSFLGEPPFDISSLFRFFVDLGRGSGLDA